MDNDLYNKSGCRDETAFKAVKNIHHEERRKLIEELKSLANQYGYEIINHIDLREVKGG